MGLVQGESMDRRFFHRLGASLLDRTICASAGGEGLAHTWAASWACRWSSLPKQADPDLGQQLDRQQPAFLALCPGGQAQRRKLVCIDPRDRDRRQMPRAHRAAPGTDAALALALMHELIVHDWLDHDYIARHTLGWGAARARAAMAARARRRGLRHAGGTDPALARDYGTTSPRPSA
jgi:anaerobic selenocysteine-containing dehydrogenase